MGAICAGTTHEQRIPDRRLIRHAATREDSDNTMNTTNTRQTPFNRRQMLHQVGMGFGALAAHSMLHIETVSASNTAYPLAPKPPPLPASAKHVVHLFLNGGPSQVDTFDPKPELTRYAGKELPIKLRTERRTGTAFPSPFKFRKFGNSGIELSEIFPNLGTVADELCVIRSMHTDRPNHEPSLLLMNCGDQRLPRPAFGSWLTYGLGTENQNLPGFVVLCPGGLPVSGTKNWRSAFLPGVFQGTRIDTNHTRVSKLVENITSPHATREQQRRQLDLLLEFNREFSSARREDTMLEARIQSFELAFRMQIEADDAFDVTREPQYIHEMYGAGVHARQMIIARRLIEKGVRFVQVWHGGGQPWDNHNDIKNNHRKLAGQCDQPIAAFIKDLRQRGLLDDTLIVCGGEFGRTPTVELPDDGANQGSVDGRDHNSYGFSVWLAGGGVKRGHTHGATDDFGFAAVEDPVHVHDLQATMLRLLGFDHEKFTYRYAGRDFRLTDVHGRVVKELIA